ncbi:hypothetical protein, partial [Pseudomonas sp. LFS044]|uniref:hypothetical protein n=1 Tax=Pseudomonas sp. LFS044 TaxID=3229880 RepID=UPI003A803544
SSVMRQGGQPWPDWNGTLQQMWERACPAKRRAGGARFAPRPKSQDNHFATNKKGRAFHMPGPFMFHPTSI